MAKKKAPSAPSITEVDAFKHTEEKRKHIPTAEDRATLEEEIQKPHKLYYERRNRDLDPQLVWRGKDEQDQQDLVVSAPPLYIQEKIHPQVLVDDLLRESQEVASEKSGHQADLFADFNGLSKEQKHAQAEFYKHDQNWTNRMILGDSLQVMASLAEREGLRGKVQCIYFDPPYGIKFNSNFQWSTTSRDVKDGKTEHITREPEQVKAFRDTWRDGIHSYLSYLRDRLVLARDLLSDSGSIFVQIGDENVHRVRCLLDEVFGDGNFCSIIQVQKTGSQAGTLLANTVDFLLWFAKLKSAVKYRQVYNERVAGHVSSDRYDQIELEGGIERRLKREELQRLVPMPDGRIFQHTSLTSSGSASTEQVFKFCGRDFRPGSSNHWKTTVVGIEKLAKIGRVVAGPSTIRYKRFIDDFSVLPITDRWESLQMGTGLIYVVQTASSVIERCILMATDPGDIVLDPTCVRKGTRVYAPTPTLPVNGEGASAEHPPVHGGIEGGLSSSEHPPVHGGIEGGLSSSELSSSGRVGLVAIETLREGDFVWGHGGSVHRVRRVIQRVYRGWMVGLFHGYSERGLWLTADHRVLAKLRPRTLGGQRDWSGSPMTHVGVRQELRRESTDSERRLWEELRGGRLGYKFRRQHSVGRYIADFYSREAHLVVEVDGAGHFTEEGVAYDIERDAYMRSMGLDVLRFSVREIEENLEGVCVAIESNCRIRLESSEGARWVQAGSLQVGDIVFWGVERKAVELKAVEGTYTKEDVYDLEVEGAHSFLTEVCAVHNCGSGTTAYVAEQWGRRWITIDTSRVALALARARLMGARYPYYLLADSDEGKAKEADITRQPVSSRPTQRSLRQGFVYERVPHITLGAIANNTEIDVIWETWQPKVQAALDALNEALRDHKTPYRVTTGGREGKDVRFDAPAGKKFTMPSGEEVAANALVEWEVPREAPADWPKKTHTLLEAFWEARIGRQKEMDASIAAKAEYEYLYDKPYEDKKKVRVAGPFTVESLSPHRVLGLDENDELLDHAADTSSNYHEGRDFVNVILDNLKAAGVQQAHKEDKIEFVSLVEWPGLMVCAEGCYMEGDTQRRAAIFIGPEFGTVSRADLVDAAREAADGGFHVLVACAFNYDAQSTEFDKLGRIPILKARMNAELHMGDALKNTGKGNLFVVFGEPDIGLKTLEDGHLQVTIHGIDVFHPNTGEVRSNDTDSIACWFIDTRYNGQSFFVRHAYFLGANDPYKSLKTTLKSDIDEEVWESLHSNISRPFPVPSSKRIAVKVINHLGDEVMKVFKV